MRTFAERFRTRLLPALLLATGVALLASGLLTYTSALEPQPVAQALQSYAPPPTLPPGLDLPVGTAEGAGQPSFPPDRVATRVVIAQLRIDLPVIAQPPNSGSFPLCDVALYFTDLGQPGSGRATYIYAHARTGMFLPLLEQSRISGGSHLLGMLVQVYTSDDQLFLYEVTKVLPHQLTLDAALNATTEQLWLQTSEGPKGTVPKLQILALPLSSGPADPAAAHPTPHPLVCG